MYDVLDEQIQSHSCSVYLINFQHSVYLVFVYVQINNEPDYVKVQY